MPDSLSAQSLVLAVVGAAWVALLGIVAWFGRTTVGNVRTTSDAVIRIETQLSGGDGTGGLRGELREVRETLRTQNDRHHAHWGDIGVWRAKKDADDAQRDRRLDEHHERLAEITGAPRRRQARRRAEDR